MPLGSILVYTYVTYWLSTELSIKRCTYVNKRKNSETGVSGRRYRNITLTCGRGWIRYAYAHRKQVVERQLYNQVPQTAWVGQPGSQFKFQLQLESVGNKMPEWEPPPDRGLGPSVTHGWAAQPRWERSTAMVARRTLGQYVAVCLRLQLTSHTQPTSTLSNKVWEVYFYKEVCSFVHWSSSLCFCLHLHIYACGYTTHIPFDSMLKFQSLEQFPVDLLSHPVKPSLVLLLCYFGLSCDSSFHAFLYIIYTCCSIAYYQFLF